MLKRIQDEQAPKVEQLDLEKLAACKPGTPLPWHRNQFGDMLSGGDESTVGQLQFPVELYPDGKYRQSRGPCGMRCNADYIVTACNAFPTLVARCQAAEQRVRELEQALRRE